MSILALRYLPDPVLRTKAKKVRKIDESIQKLIEDMFETMQEEGGVGLAANQVGVLQRVAIVRIADEEPIVLINPEVVRREGEREVQEGCLSIPGYVGIVTRSQQVSIKAIDRQGKSFRLKAQHLLAQALEHEIDHLNGVLYIDHLDSHDQLFSIEDLDAVEVTGATG